MRPPAQINQGLFGGPKRATNKFSKKEVFMELLILLVFAIVVMATYTVAFDT